MLLRVVRKGVGLLLLRQSLMRPCIGPSLSLCHCVSFVVFALPSHIDRKTLHGLRLYFRHLFLLLCQIFVRRREVIFKLLLIKVLLMLVELIMMLPLMIEMLVAQPVLGLRWFLGLMHLLMEVRLVLLRFMLLLLRLIQRRLLLLGLVLLRLLLLLLHRLVLILTMLLLLLLLMVNWHVLLRHRHVLKHGFKHWLRLPLRLRLRFRDRLRLLWHLLRHVLWPRLWFWLRFWFWFRLLLWLLLLRLSVVGFSRVLVLLCRFLGVRGVVVRRRRSMRIFVHWLRAPPLLPAFVEVHFPEVSVKRRNRLVPSQGRHVGQKRSEFLLDFQRPCLVCKFGV